MTQNFQLSPAELTEYSIFAANLDGFVRGVRTAIEEIKQMRLREIAAKHIPDSPAVKE
jgi:hypothetical protein